MKREEELGKCKRQDASTVSQIEESVSTLGKPSPEDVLRKTTKKGENDNLLYNIYNIAGKKEKEEVKDRKILGSTYVSGLLWDSAKRFAHFMEISRSVLVEKALAEYMVKHASELPVAATFNLVPIPEKAKKCGFRDCKLEAVAIGIYLPRKEEYLLCERHLKEVENTREWKLLQHECEAHSP